MRTGVYSSPVLLSHIPAAAGMPANRSLDTENMVSILTEYYLGIKKGKFQAFIGKASGK